MPTLPQLKQYLTLSVVPVLAGAAGNWLVVHVHFLAAFHVHAGSVIAGLTQLGVFGVSAGLAFLASHHILKGTYTPPLPLPLWSPGFQVGSGVGNAGNAAKLAVTQQTTPVSAGADAVTPTPGVPPAS